MSQKRRKPRVQYELLTLQVEDYSVTVNASISYRARELRPESDKTPLYSFGHTIEIVGTCTSPDERARETYRIIMEPPEFDEHTFDTTLSDVQVKDANGLVKYRKILHSSCVAVTGRRTSREAPRPQTDDRGATESGVPPVDQATTCLLVPPLRSEAEGRNSSRCGLPHFPLRAPVDG